MDVVSIQQLDNIVCYRLRYINRGRCAQIWHKSPKPRQNVVAAGRKPAIAAVFGRFSYGIPVSHEAVAGRSPYRYPLWLARALNSAIYDVKWYYEGYRTTARIAVFYVKIAVFYTKFLLLYPVL